MVIIYCTSEHTFELRASKLINFDRKQLGQERSGSTWRLGLGHLSGSVSDRLSVVEAETLTLNFRGLFEKRSF